MFNFVFFKRDSKELIELILLIVGLSFAAFISLYNLDHIPIIVWDEGRNAVNAMEMYLNGNFIYTTYNTEVDDWNTKPPLLIWLQVASMHIFGPGEFGLRFPVALSGIGIAILLMWFSKREFKSYSIGFIATLCLFTCKGFIEIHGLQTGDFDVLLTFFLLAFLFHFYFYLKDYNKINLIIAFICFALALLTKGVAAFFYLPGLFIFGLFSGKLLPTIRTLDFWKYLSIPVIIALCYYIIREKVTPGYLKLVWDNELFGRYMVVNEDNSGSGTSYIDYLKGYRFGITLLIISGLSLPLSLYLKKNVKVVLFLFSVLIFFMLTISVSKTKLYWYVIPAYPLFSILVAVTLNRLGSLFTKSLKIKTIVSTVVVLAVFYSSFVGVVKEKLSPPDIGFKERFFFVKLLRDGIRNDSKIDTSFHYIDFEDYKPHYLFYSYILGYFPKFEKIGNLESLDGLKVCAGLEEVNKYILANYKNTVKLKTEGEYVYYHVRK